MSTEIDVARARARTPGCGHVTHLDNAGAALPDQAVLDALIGHIELESRVGGYAAAAAVEPALEHTYDAIATLLGCHRLEIAVVQSATQAWGAAFTSLRFRPGDRILVSRAEYVSNALAVLQVSARTGVAVEVVPDDVDGQLDVDALARLLDERVKLVAVTHVPTQGGLVNPAPEIGRLTRAAGVPFLLDACQSAGQLRLDVEELGCDLLSATGRKFLRAPRGTGFLYVRGGLLDQLEPPLPDARSASWTGPCSYELRPDARRFEHFERSVAGHVALGVAVDEALAWGLDAIEARVVELGDRLRGRLASLPGVTICDLGRRRCAIVTFTVDGWPAAEVGARLAAEGVNVSVPVAGSARYDLPDRGLDAVVRASPHYYNTDDELDRLVDIVASLSRRSPATASP